MDSGLKTHINNLREVLLSLPHSGDSGFEGLIGLTLWSITGIPFRLAGSGSQFGVDGKSSFKIDPICFECKRYDDSPSRESILSKITDFSINDHEVDIWVLASTASIKTQLIDDVRKAGDKNGLFVFVLDWSDSSLPLLAAALAKAGRCVEDFISSNAKCSPSLLSSVIPALTAINQSAHQQTHINKIKSELDVAHVSYSSAQRANESWLLDKFSDRAEAKVHFGQPICPNALHANFINQRKSLVQKLEPYYVNDNLKRFAVVSGKEGSGKSWILAQSWLAQKNKPILLFFSPEDLPNRIGDFDVSELIVKKLIKQTGQKTSLENEKRWLRLFEQWKDSNVSNNKKIVIVIDGINQKPTNNWGALLDAICIEARQLNASVVVSTREQYFDNFVRNRLESAYEKIDIPEWSISERDEILLKNGIIGADLSPKVARSLCNPRLLGISLELLSQEEIENIADLNVSRLLFEHMRAIERNAREPIPFASFVKRLINDANEIQNRIAIGQEDDLKVFEGELAIVADGRFYELLDDAPSSYYLKEEGVTLALSFSIIEKLKKAFRNGRNLDDVLNKIIDPIAALDDTSDVIISAITISTLDDKCNDRILEALLHTFVQLQNPNAEDYPVFACAAKEKPLAFVVSARSICLEDCYQTNFDWLQTALVFIASEEGLWKSVEKEVISWLAIYSLSPELSTYKDSKEELQKKSDEITDSINAMSKYEHEVLSNLERNDNYDSNKLSELALSLLAGKPLAKYAKDLFHWKFGQVLNSSYHSPYKDFYSLIRLNNIDWLETKQVFHSFCEQLRREDVSRTGKWTLINILRAIGDTKSGIEDEQLVAELTKDRESLKGWRLIEKYCSADPCDPESKKPQNVSATAKKYEGYDANKIHISFSTTADDLFIESACYGLSRFVPNIAVQKRREIIDSVITRNGLELRQGMFGISRHIALLTKDHASAFIDKWKAMDKCEDATQHKWLIRQYLLTFSFPHLTSNQQLDIFLSHSMEENMMLDLFTSFKPLDNGYFEKHICKILESKDQHLMLLSLLLIRYTDCRLTECMRQLIAYGWQQGSKKIKTEILAIAAKTQDPDLLKLVVDSELNASEAFENKTRAEWYFSMALLEALKKGLISSIETLARISPSAYGRAVAYLDDKGLMLLIELIDKSLKLSIELEAAPENIEIEIDVSNLAPNEPNRYSIKGLKATPKTHEQHLMSIIDHESIEDFNKRQQRAHESFERFRCYLSRQNASIVLGDITKFELQTMINSNNAIIDKWFNLFISLGQSKLPAIYNIVLKFCFAIHDTEPNKSLQLLDKISSCQPWVNHVFGKAKISLKSHTYWSFKGEQFTSHQFSFLDKANTDKELMLVVVAALLNNRHELLNEYISQKTSRIEPSEVARGIMVAGFSDQSAFNDKVLEKYKDEKGLLGQSYQAAMYAYNRNNWSRHWYKLMNNTKSLEDYWCYNQLFLKIVDQRFEVWKTELFSLESLDKKFQQSYKSKLKRRYEKWNNHREKKLFGLDAPKAIFINN